MTKKYPIILYPVERDGRTSYSVLVPDLPGCVSYGDTQQEALESARAAIDLHIQALIENGDAIPEPSSVDQVSDKDELHAVYALVEIPLSEIREKALTRKSTRINITFPENLLRKVDEYCEQTGFARSKFFQVLTERFLRDVNRVRHLEEAENNPREVSLGLLSDAYLHAAELMGNISLHDEGHSEWQSSCDSWLSNRAPNSKLREDSFALLVSCLLAGFKAIKQSQTDKENRGESELSSTAQKEK
jgi:predicted RNase H-like HicB family nuclease